MKKFYDGLKKSMVPLNLDHHLSSAQMNLLSLLTKTRSQSNELNILTVY